MQYFSPFKLFNTDIPQDGTFDIKLLKKKTLSEFELSGSGTLKIQNQEFSKNDILVIFDQLQDEKIIGYHKAIAEDKNLINFLENNYFEESFKKNSIYNDEEFLLFISPYFANSYCSLILNILNIPGFTCPKIMKLDILIHPSLKYKLMEPIRKKINNLISDVESLKLKVKNQFYFVPDKFCEQVYSFNVLRTLSTIEYSVFKSEIELFVKTSLSVVNSCINDKNTGFNNKEFVEFVLNRIKNLKMDNENNEKIKHYLRAINPSPQYSSSNTNTKSEPGYKLIIRVVILIIVLLRLLVTCSH
jgi:hypothetical protein